MHGARFELSFIGLKYRANNYQGPEAGFEPATGDPQSHMLPGYTTRAILPDEGNTDEILIFC